MIASGMITEEKAKRFGVLRSCKVPVYADKVDVPVVGGKTELDNLPLQFCCW